MEGGIIEGGRRGKEIMGGGMRGMGVMEGGKRGRRVMDEGKRGLQLTDIFFSTAFFPPVSSFSSTFLLPLLDPLTSSQGGVHMSTT